LKPLHRKLDLLVIPPPMTAMPVRKSRLMDFSRAAL
jgi:hypothetical protein